MFLLQILAALLLIAAGGYAGLMGAIGAAFGLPEVPGYSRNAVVRPIAAVVALVGLALYILGAQLYAATVMALP